MRTLHLAAIAVALLVAPVAHATVNHGTFVGTNVDFVNVSETTGTAGDPEPLWEAPTLNGAGDGLLFNPTAYISSCAAGSSDITSSQLQIELVASGAGATIDTVSFAESGDTILTHFPPFGTPTTNTSVSLSGFVTVTETTSGPIVPVIIPFLGTFAPTDTFSLPVDFGTSLWTGSTLIDVMSQVPNATKAMLSLDNTLTANCEPGSTSASIQKKVVGGPTVAITVNPIECDLDLDKTCCVTQPVLPDLGQCEGDMVYMDLEFTGDKCRHSNNDQGRAFRCHGHRRIEPPASVTILRNASVVSATPNSNIGYGDVVRFESTEGTLRQRTKWKTKGAWWRKQYTKVDTSCERAFACDDTFGAWKVAGFESTLGGVVDCSAPAGPAVCATAGDPVGTPCDAKFVDMVLEYNGQACQNPLGNPQNGSASCAGDATGATNVGVVYTGNHPSRVQVAPASNINDGDLVRVTAVHQGGLPPNQKFLISDSGGVLQTIDFHVSCSQPIALGDEFGSFKLVEFTTKNGTHAELGDGTDGTADACEVPLAPPGPHCTSDLQEVTLVYIGDFLGEGCSVSNPQGGFGTCSGVADPGDPVSVVVAGGLDIEPDDQIEFGDLVTISDPNGGDLPSFINLDVTGAGGSQGLQIKANCWKPLNLGDRFGSFVVFGMDREDEGPVALGGNVQYQYKVTNPNGSAVDNVTITDNQLGIIASGVSIPAGGMQTFTTNATLFGTTTNVATATGDVGGDVCDPGVDQVTINVTAPPPGAFHCSEPLSELTMIWDGAQTVDVKVWEGAANASTLLTTYNDVAPGDAVEATGLGADYPVFEIFESDGVTKIGESSFDLWCNDWSMNGMEDCGKNNGNLKTNEASLINDWLLEGMVDTDETLACTPGLVPNPPACGFGPELIFVMPGLMWMHRRRLRKQR